MGFTFAIGDVHGCLSELRDLLGDIEDQAPSGHIVFLGDYVDRGPDSRGVLELVMAGPRTEGWRWTALKGNHEDMMVRSDTVALDRNIWLENGGQETLQSFGGSIPDSVLRWCADLPMIHVDENRIFVHAAVDDSLPLAAQKSRDLMWKRFSDDYSSDFWGRHLCHGHTPQPENPVTIGNRTNVDSGCVFGGALSCAVFDDEKPGGPLRFLHVPSRGPGWPG